MNAWTKFSSTHGRYMRYSPDCRYVVAVDPGKTYGLALWEKKDGLWKLTNCKVGRGLPRWLYCIRDYQLALVCEGTCFGKASRPIQRCIGRFEGILGVEALLVPVGTWRRAVYTPSEYRKTLSETRSPKKWKDLAVKRAKVMGWERKLSDVGGETHHAAEAALLGYGYASGLIPQKALQVDNNT